MKPLIAFDRVSFSYESAQAQSIPALIDISLTIEQGEYVAVIGANGSGKSTLSRLASALFVPRAGSVWVDGLDTRQPQNRHKIYATIGMVFQFPEDQIVSTTVEEDVAFGPENLGLPPAEIRLRVESALAAVNLLEERRRPPHLLSAGQIQRLALAGVLAMRPRCIIFDEASTMLDPAGRRALIQVMQRLHQEGTTILTVTHFMDEAALADRVIVLNSGRIVLDGPPEEIFSNADQLAALRLDLPPAGRVAAALRMAIPQLSKNLLTLPDLLAALPDYQAGENSPRQIVQYEQRPADGKPAMIAVDELGYTYMAGTPLAHRALSGVSLTVAEGQAHGFLGMTGSGKTTLMQHLNALLHPQEGRLRVGAFDMNDAHIDRRQVVRTVGLVFQNPEAQFFEHFVGDEIAYGPRQLKVEEPLAERVRWAMEQVGLDFLAYKDRPLRALSGGERRKVALASTMALRPSVLLLDEPTAGLDPFSRRDLLTRLASMRDSGITLVLSSHRMEDLARLTDSLTVFNSGHNVLSGTTQNVFQQSDDLHRYGMVAPVSVQVANALRAKGWPLPDGILTSDMLREAALQASHGVAL